MPTTTRRRNRAAPIAPDAAETDLLRSLLTTLQDHGAVLMNRDGREIDMPPTAVAALTRAVEYLASGEPVVILPADAELTTGEAAEILHFSRQYLVRLLDDGVIPCRRDGVHRRVLLRDVIRYRERRIVEQEAAITRLIRYSEEMGEYAAPQPHAETEPDNAGLGMSH
jgi:excisionase family DNA binding protein